MSQQRNVATKVDWAKITSSLGLRGNTANALNAFKKRNDDARRKVQILSEQAQTVDFAYYRGILNNRAVIDEVENAVKNFKVQSYDVSRQLKAIDAFEAQAVKNAEETAGLVETELKDLEKTLTNIQSARPFEDLTVVCYSMENPAGTKLPSLIWLTPCYRTKSWPPSLLLRNVLRRWSATTGGCRLDTRYVLQVFTMVGAG